MTDHNDPVKDIDRLSALAGYDVFSPEVQEVLDAFAARAAARFDLPIGLVSIVLDDSQYLAGAHGVEGWMAETRGTPVEWSFCAQVVRGRDQYVVTNAETDALQSANPLVTQDGIRSYAGTPIMTSDGHILGSFCVIGATPREFTPTEMEELRQMANEVIAELERRKTAA